jgi:hypothetical protein
LPVVALVLAAVFLIVAAIVAALFLPLMLLAMAAMLNDVWASIDLLFHHVPLSLHERFGPNAWGDGVRVRQQARDERGPENGVSAPDHPLTCSHFPSGEHHAAVES